MLFNCRSMAQARFTAVGLVAFNCPRRPPVVSNEARAASSVARYIPYPAAAPISPAPRTCISLIALAISADRAHFFDHETVRKKALIDQLDDAVVRFVGPDRPVMLTAYFHERLECDQHSCKARSEN